MLASVAIPTSELPSSPADPEPDGDVERLRGVVALTHRRVILFSDDVELDAGSLSHWRPQIHLDERRLDDDDHA
jgi:hypothetical protein